MNYKLTNIKNPWIEKYRPDVLNDVILDPFIKQKITEIIKTKNIPNIILHGSPGTGKTSTILIIAKKIYQEYYDECVLELNASDDRGLSIIINTITPFCEKNTKISQKLIILDEADSITAKAQQLLSTLISDFSTKCRFAFICNSLTKINESIQSKCMIVNFKTHDISRLFNQVIKICKIENIPYEEDAVNDLINISNNDLRKIINNLECIYYTFNKVSIDNIYKLFDKPKLYYITNILELCKQGELYEANKILIKIYESGYNINDILLAFIDYLMSDKINNITKDEKINILQIISKTFINVNDGHISLIQLLGCISNIYINYNC